MPSRSGYFYINAHGWVDDEGATSTGQYTLTLSESAITETYTFDQIATYLTSGYWSERSWNDMSLTFNVQGLTAAQATLARAALDLWASYTALTFTEVTSGGQIVFTSDNPNPSDDTEQDAHASNTVSGGVITQSTVNISDNWFGGDTSLDSYTFQTYLHEIGHALGLGHAGPYNSTAVYGQDNIYINDNWSYTLMSYFDQAEAGFGSYRFALGPQIADILAIQDLYGTNPDGTHAGNTTYGFNSTESDINDWSQFVIVQSEGTYLRPPSYAIYDTGGIDTIDLSGFSNDQTLSLIPETFSSLGDRADISAPTYVNNVSIMRGTIIENAIGGSGNDTITANSANNQLTGGAGNDRFVFAPNGGTDSIMDFQVGSDLVDLTAFDSAAALNAFQQSTQVGNDTQITVNGQTIILVGITSNALSQSNFVFASAAVTVTASDDSLTTPEASDLSGSLLSDNGNGVDSSSDGSPLSITSFNGVALNGGSVAVQLEGAAQIVVHADGTFDLTVGDAFLFYGSADTVTFSFNYVLSNGSVTDTGTVNISIDTQDPVPTSGNDTLYASNGSDVLDALAGNDIIFAGNGNDTITGGQGSDTIHGGEGTDTAVFGFLQSQATLFTYNGVLYVGDPSHQSLDHLDGVEILSFQDGAIDAGSVGALDPLQYTASYPDLIASFGLDAEQAATHLINQGFLEGRVVDSFDALGYLAGYADLLGSFGADLELATRHYIEAGYAEGRVTTAFDALRYIASYSDLIASFGLNDQAAMEHYVYQGFSEGRVTDGFRPLEYVASYTDLIAAFGTDQDLATRHYIEAGYFEGRTDTAFNALQYIASYGDLIASFGLNRDLAAEHYVVQGINEGRTANGFNALQYLAGYTDLLAAFGTNLDLATSHYIEAGFAEGRSTSAFDPIQYIASYGDLIVSFGLNGQSALQHYVYQGYGEGRAADDFDAQQYLNNYADLQASFGSDLNAATQHFITNGYFEGRTDAPLPGAEKQPDVVPFALPEDLHASDMFAGDLHADQFDFSDLSQPGVPDGLVSERAEIFVNSAIEAPDISEMPDFRFGFYEFAMEARALIEDAHHVDLILQGWDHV
ncbi:MAG: M10 family metallopeptidase [Hyphomonas sp.]